MVDEADDIKHINHAGTSVGGGFEDGGRYDLVSSQDLDCLTDHIRRQHSVDWLLFFHDMIDRDSLEELKELVADRHGFGSEQRRWDEE